MMTRSNACTTAESFRMARNQAARASASPALSSPDCGRRKRRL